MNELLKNPAIYFAVIAISLIVGITLVAGNSKMSPQTSLTSEERAAELAKEGKREQLITYSTGMVPLPDDPLVQSKTEANLFLIGVSQITLEQPEPTVRVSSSASFRGFKTTAIGANGGAWYVYQPDVIIDGPLNNALIFDKRTGAATKIFNERISISRLCLLKSPKPRVLAIIATGKDSNKDGSIDADDLQELYLYGLDGGGLHKVTGIAAGVNRVMDVGHPDYVVVEAVIDSNKNGQLERGTNSEIPEPARLYRVDLKTFAAMPLIADTLTAELQAIVDTPAPPPATN